MRLLALQANNFRNLAEVVLDFHPRFNVFFGDNGQGKTNLLEAIYLLGTLRSFRATKTEQLVRLGMSEARVKARVVRKDLERVFEVTVRPGGKTARIDGKVQRSTDYFGGFNTVLFAPEDLQLPKGAPGERRRFIDRAIFNATPLYLAEAQTYERVLKSRNALLRDADGRMPNLAQLEVYDDQLAHAAVPLAMRRAQLVEALAPRVERAFSRITQTGLRLALRYETDFGGTPEQIIAQLLERLKADRARDAARGATSAGPHTDDLQIDLDGQPARHYASQGQLRATVLALKIAEIELLAELLGDSPTFLLDDVSSELDTAKNDATV